MKKSFPLNFHLIFDMDLPNNSFLVDGNEYDVPCVFQIWQKKESNRTIPEKQDPVHFMFVKKNENPDISVRRVGVNAGVIDTDIEQKSIQSHYFIRFTGDIPLSYYLDRLKQITYEFNNTVGPRSISKQELIEKFNQHM